MGYPIQQNQTAQPLNFLMVDSADHVTGKTGLTPTVTLSKNGAAFAAPAGAVSEIGNGWYKVAPNATDANTLGPLELHATSAGADPADETYPVVAYNPLSGANLGLTDLDAAISSRMASGNVTVGGYAAGEDPATLLLVTPANKIATDGSGRMTVAPAGLDPVLVEGSINFRQAMQLTLASASGTLSGAGTTQIIINGAGTTTPRVTANVDNQGNRTSVILNPTP